MKVQLYSGGLDSYVISKLWKPDIKLFIDYGTEQNKEEKKHLPPDTIIKKIELAEYTQDDGINTIPLRNLIFAAVAVNYGDEILIGGLKSDLHFDKTQSFADMATELFNSVLTKERQPKKVKIVTPFVGYTKTELLKDYFRIGGTVKDLDANSFSCHSPINHKPCGICQACKARAKAIRGAMA